MADVNSNLQESSPKEFHSKESSPKEAKNDTDVCEDISETCWGCSNGEPNQMAHIGPNGCLGNETS